jgi:HNH endonuclease
MGRRYSRDWHDHVIPVPWTGCWLWEGDALKGYGTHRLDNKNRAVHRLAWEEVNGPIPSGLLVCHHCDVKLCCNPQHLFLGTAKDNARDLYSKGMGYQASITHCPKGHKYTPENTYVWASSPNKRFCRICVLAGNRAYALAHRAETNERARLYQQRRRAKLRCQE